MPIPADIAVDSPLGDTVLVVECKATRETTAAEAVRRIHRGLMAHGLIPKGAFFLLAMPSALHLWTPESQIDAEPSFSAPAQPVLKEYLGAIADQTGGPRGESLELAISSWLSDLAGNLRMPAMDSAADAMLVTSGLYQQIKGGHVRTGFNA